MLALCLIEQPWCRTPGQSENRQGGEREQQREHIQPSHRFYVSVYPRYVVPYVELVNIMNTNMHVRTYNACALEWKGLKPWNGDNKRKRLMFCFTPNSSKIGGCTSCKHLNATHCHLAVELMYKNWVIFSFEPKVGPLSSKYLVFCLNLKSLLLRLLRVWLPACFVVWVWS